MSNKFQLKFALKWGKSGIIFFPNLSKIILLLPKKYSFTGWIKIITQCRITLHLNRIYLLWNNDCLHLLRYIKSQGNSIQGNSKQGKFSCLLNKVLVGHWLNANLQCDLNIYIFLSTRVCKHCCFKRKADGLTLMCTHLSIWKWVTALADQNSHWYLPPPVKQ